MSHRRWDISSWFSSTVCGTLLSVALAPMVVHHGNDLVLVVHLSLLVMANHPNMPDSISHSSSVAHAVGRSMDVAHKLHTMLLGTQVTQECSKILVSSHTAR